MEADDLRTNSHLALAVILASGKTLILFHVVILLQINMKTHKDFTVLAYSSSLILSILAL